MAPGLSPELVGELITGRVRDPAGAASDPVPPGVDIYSRDIPEPARPETYPDRDPDEPESRGPAPLPPEARAAFDRECPFMVEPGTTLYHSGSLDRMDLGGTWPDEGNSGAGESHGPVPATCPVQDPDPCGPSRMPNLSAGIVRTAPIDPDPSGGCPGGSCSC